MKRLSFLFSIGSLAVVSLLSSCKKDEEVKPAASMIAFIGTSAVSSKVSPAGELVTITYEANSGEKLTKLELNKRTATGSTIVDGFPKNPTGTNEKGTVTVTSDGTEVFYDFKVTDSKGSTATKTITLNPSAGTLNTYEAKLLGNQDNATVGGFFSTTDGNVYTQAQAKDKSSLIDFVYYHGTTNGATIAAPNDESAGTIYNNTTNGLQTWSTKNATKFAMTTMTAAQFDAIATGAAAQTAAMAATSDTKANSLSTGKVFAFKTQGGKFGLAKVTSITGTAATAGSITISVKVQK